MATIKKSQTSNELVTVSVNKGNNNSKLVMRSRREIIEQTKVLLILILKLFNIYDKLIIDEPHDAPRVYDDHEVSRSEKVEEKQLIEPNLWNEFDDYCFIHLEKFLVLDEPIDLYNLQNHQKKISVEFFKKKFKFKSDSPQSDIDALFEAIDKEQNSYLENASKFLLAFL
jgi:hypothetical protein